MDMSIFLILLQDGVVTGAIYALLALALVLVFTVTRVILIPVGEFVSYGALTMAALELKQTPGTVTLLAVLGVAAFARGLMTSGRPSSVRALAALALETLVVPGAIALAGLSLAPLNPPQAVKIVLALAIVTAMGPLIYRVVFQPLESASVLVLLIAAVGVHLGLTGLGLLFFGAEGSRTEPLLEGSYTVGLLTLSGQALVTLATTLALIIALYGLFERTRLGKALQATAVNRTGARLVGISPQFAGRLAFTLAAFIGALSGVLIAPLATIYYDTGFLTGLKGFVGAIVAGLAGYPLAAAAAMAVGLVEAFASFYASEYKEVIVFLSLIPVLLWRSLSVRRIEEDEHGEAAMEIVRSWLTRALPFVAFAGMLAVPFVPGLPPFTITLLNYLGLSAIVALGLVVLTGVGGITSFGQAMFVGLGAYTTALLTTKYGFSPWATLPLAVGLTALAAWFIGVITLRLSGHYLPLGTLAWNIAFVFAAGNSELLNRNDGLSGLPPLSVFGFSLGEPSRNYYAIYVALALSVMATNNLLSSRMGRAIRALKGGTIAAESFGIDTSNAKILAFVYAACLAALSGWLYAHLQRAVNPTPFNLNASIEYLLMAVVGGAGHVWGAIAGAALVTLVKDQLQNVLPLIFGGRGNYEAIVFGVILVVILQTAQEGLWPRLVRACEPLLRWARGAGARPLSEVPAMALDPEATQLNRRRPTSVEAPALLDVSGLVRRFGGLIAINKLDFRVRQGEIVGLIGPNGAGKSTTFNQIAGVDRPDDGRILYKGADIARWPARKVAKLGIARTFQHVKLVPSMSVLANVALGAHLKGHAGALRAIFNLDGAEEAVLKARARLAIARVGLAGTEDKPAVSLSLGQQRLVEIARALCLEPKFLLLDEPAAGLRHLEKAALGELLRKLADEGLTILLVEHDMDFVMGLTDHLIVMNFGTKLAEGPPSRIRSDPAVIEAYLGGVA